MSNNYLTDEDLIYNTSSRVPICLCIDTSGSMSMKDDSSKSRMDRVKEGMAKFYSDLENDETASASAEVAIVGFSDSAYLVQNFRTIENIEDRKNIQLIPHEGGDLAEGIFMSLDVLEERKNMYKENGIDYYQPWLIIMSDGHPTNKNKTDAVMRNELARACKKVTELEENKKLTVVPVYIGKQDGGDDVASVDKKADKYLSSFSKKNPIVSLDSDENFSRFFEWLGKSVGMVTFGSNGSGPELDFADFTDWDDI